MEKETVTYIIRKGLSGYRLVPFDAEKGKAFDEAPAITVPPPTGKVLYFDIVVNVMSEPPESITIDLAASAMGHKAEFDTYLIMRGKLRPVPPHVLN